LPVAQAAVPGESAGVAAGLLAGGALELGDGAGVVAALDEDGALAAVPPLPDAHPAASTAAPSRMAAVPARRATRAEDLMIQLTPLCRWGAGVRPVGV
jgi:hypothetical protein